MAVIPTSKSVITLDKFGAPDDIKPKLPELSELSLNTLGADVLVALMGKRLDVKTIDLTGDQIETVAISWNI